MAGNEIIDKYNAEMPDIKSALRVLGGKANLTQILEFLTKDPEKKVDAQKIAAVLVLATEPMSRLAKYSGIMKEGEVYRLLD